MSLLPYMSLFRYSFIRQYLLCPSSQKECTFSLSPYAALVGVGSLAFFSPRSNACENKIAWVKVSQTRKAFLMALVIKKEKVNSSELKSVETRLGGYHKLG